jgi:MYXO-CTERM domain-containing protein
MIAALLASSAALAWESEPQPVVLVDSATLFSGASFDTGWVPSGSPLAVRFQIEPTGGAEVEMEGEAALWWPDGLNLEFLGAPGTGFLAIAAGLDAVTSVQFDIDIYSWESEIDRRGVEVEGEAAFDPFLLEGGSPDAVTVVSDGLSDEVVDFAYTVFTGVEVAFTVDLQPVATTTFRGVRFVADDGSVDRDGESVAVDYGGAPTEEVDTTFTGRWSGGLDMVLTPTFSVCILGSCTDLVAVDIPLSMAADDFEQDFPSEELSFPLPLLQTDAVDHDFGEVEVGALANLQLGIANAGDLDLEGEAGMLGSTYFTAYPDYFLAGPGQEDGLVVTFAPESAGSFSTVLTLASSDPGTPNLEIVLTGTGVDPDADTGPDSMPTISAEVGGCGCSSGGVGRPGGVALGVGLLGLLLARRRGPRRS